MKTRQIFETKKLSTAKPGELIIITATGNWYAIVLAADAHSTLLAYLQPVTPNERDGYAFYQVIKEDPRCLSYGTDWLLEPTIDDGLFRSPNNVCFTGGLYLDGNSYVAEFSLRDKDFSNRRFFNLTDGKLVEGVNNSALIFGGWKISIPSADGEKPTQLLEVKPSQMR
ncbi:hypothetical protein ASC80_07380 [Afipia sp. Root123D2]|uniref:hypothetical protein n=1 Tax=Afipia sp. Root123D2 TaxID=1736436 RepID=UPI0006F3344F|nr:hypothetical protein [Afipia sp. Root123D2]KQW23118.1 hypothetical protein ASC80_07380 [Afipia sp. Root123D2]